MTDAVIGLTSNKQYVVCTRKGDVLAGPFESSEKAISARTNLGFKPKVELGKPSITESNAPGLEGYFICIDNLPYIPVKGYEDAQAVLRAFEMGLVALIHKRFLGGLGDLIVLSGAAVMLEKIHGSLVLTSTDKYKAEFERIFADYPNIKLDVILTREGQFIKDDISENLLFHDETISLVGTPLDEFERTYKHFGIPYEYRWDACPIEKACGSVKQLPVPEGKYAFIHDDTGRGYCLNRKRLPNMALYHPDNADNESILSFKDVLEHAAEIHLIDSVFFHLVESLKPKGRLFFHRYARPYNRRYNDYKTRYTWKVLV